MFRNKMEAEKFMTRQNRLYYVTRGRFLSINQISINYSIHGFVYLSVRRNVLLELD